jgi:hypothetical protein
MLLLAACSGGQSEVLPTTVSSPLPTPRGWMLSSGHSFGQGLLATRLPGGQPRRMDLPNDSVVFAARWAEPGKTAYAFVQPNGDRHAVQLVRVALDGPPRAVGARLENVSATAVVSAADSVGGVFMAATCAHATGWVDVMAGGESMWRRVAPGCRATLSPDGRTVAFSDDGHTVQTVPAAGGTPATAFDSSAIPAVTSAGLAGARIQDMAWGEAGIGVVLHRGRSYAVLIHTEHGDHLARVPGVPSFVGALRWRPSGPLLAVATFFGGQGSIMRAIDARTGDIRVLATDPRGLGGTVWSPDGSLLASLDSRGAWIFVDGNGNRATLVPVDNELPFDWGT